MERPDPRGRAMLRAYRSAKVSPPADRDALWARIEASLDQGARGPRLEPSSTLEPLPLVRPRGWVAPVVGVAVAVAAVVVAALAFRPGESRETVARPAPSAAAHEVGLGEPAQAAPARRATDAPTMAAPSASPMPAHVPPVEPSIASHRRATLPTDREPLPTASASASPETEDPVEETTDALVAELMLVREARHALRAERPARALELLDAHAQAFPEGQMREDREVLRIEALCAAGKAPQARAEVRQFLRAFPGSAHAQRVRAACAEP
jgi:hypothetical protein